MSALLATGDSLHRHTIWDVVGTAELWKGAPPGKPSQELESLACSCSYQMFLKAITGRNLEANYTLHCIYYTLTYYVPLLVNYYVGN